MVEFGPWEIRCLCRVVKRVSNCRRRFDFPEKRQARGRSSFQRPVDSIPVWSRSSPPAHPLHHQQPPVAIAKGERERESERRSRVVNLVTRSFLFHRILLPGVAAREKPTPMPTRARRKATSEPFVPSRPLLSAIRVRPRKGWRCVPGRASPRVSYRQRWQSSGGVQPRDGARRPRVGRDVGRASGLAAWLTWRAAATYTNGGSG